MIISVLFYKTIINPFYVDIQGTYYEKNADKLVPHDTVSIAFDIRKDKRFYLTDFSKNLFYVGNMQEIEQGCYLLICDDSNAQEYFPVQILKLKHNNKKIALNFSDGEKEFVKYYDFLMFQGHNNYI